MEKLYYIDQYIKEFIAEIEDIKEIDNKFHIKLDKTAFFPGGGGQPCDLGFIDKHEVIDVYEENREIYHILKEKPIKIHRVKCKIDWNRRFDFMQQHLAQHTLSGCFFKLLNHNTCGIHLGKDISTIDIVGKLSEDEVKTVEKMANDKINEAIRVEFLTPSRSELKKLGLRRALPNTREQIRVVKIGDLDINACCGVHPSSTVELQAIRLKKAYNHKGNTRIEYLAGGRAIKDYLDRCEFSLTICKTLNCNEDEALNSIKNSNELIKTLMNENKTLRLEVSEYKSRELVDNAIKIKDLSLIKEVYDNESVKNVSKLANRLILEEKVIALFAIKNGDKANIIFASSKDIEGINMGELLKDAISLIDGKGGGSKTLAQGGGKNNNNLEAVLNYAYMKIKEKY